MCQYKRCISNSTAVKMNFRNLNADFETKTRDFEVKVNVTGITRVARRQRSSPVGRRSEVKVKVTGVKVLMSMQNSCQRHLYAKYKTLPSIGIRRSYNHFSKCKRRTLNLNQPLTSRSRSQGSKFWHAWKGLVLRHGCVK